MKSLPSPLSIETYRELLLMESLPRRAFILTSSPVFVIVSLTLVVVTVLFFSSLLILTGVSMILTLERFAAPCRVILPSPTVRIISEPLLIEEGALWAEMLSVESALKPRIISLPSP